jgi:hypothetical protein
LHTLYSRILDAEPFTPFGASAAQNLAPGRGAHTSAEPMHTFPLDLTGLVCSFHKNSPWQKYELNSLSLSFQSVKNFADP